jgi:hypothetical protein
VIKQGHHGKQQTNELSPTRYHHPLRTFEGTIEHTPLPRAKGFNRLSQVCASQNWRLKKSAKHPKIIFTSISLDA